MALNLGNLSTRREQVLVLFFTLAIVVMFYRALYSPKKAVLAQLDSQIKTLTLEKESLEKFTKALVQRIPEAQPSALSKRLVTKIKILNGDETPLAKDVAEIFSYLTSKEIGQGVTITEIADKPYEKMDGFQKGKFKLIAEGSFGNITKYLDRIEEIAALVTIDNIALKSVAPKAAKIHIELDGSFYSMGGV